MDVVDDRQNVASLLSGHQDLTPNSDATRLRLDPPTISNFREIWFLHGYPVAL